MSNAITVPMRVEFNRPFIDLEFHLAAGTKRTACTWVDTGGGAFILTEKLVRELGLEFGEAEGSFAPILHEPDVYLDGMRLELSGAPVLVQINSSLFSPGFPAEAFMPGRVLNKYHVIFDYPNETFTLAAPQSLEPSGTKFSTPISSMGFPRIELELQGKHYGFLLDTGASYTMLSKAVMKELGVRQVKGAVGTANMGMAGEENLPLARVTAKLGNVVLENMGVVARPEGIFEGWMSDLMTSPIVGALAGNVLKAFRVEIDYAKGYTYLGQTGKLEPHDLDLVGLVLRPEKDGTYTVVGLSEQHDAETFEHVRPGDKLLTVNQQSVNGHTMAEVVDFLRGNIGERKMLRLERQGAVVEARVPVVRVL